MTTRLNTGAAEKGMNIDVSDGFAVGEWVIDAKSRRATSTHGVVRIDPRNLRVLQLLVGRHGELVSAREIEQFAWEGVVVTPDSLYQSIRQLRQALGDTKDPPKYIETVPRKGYRLIAPVSKFPVVENHEPQLSIEKLSVPAATSRFLSLPVALTATALVTVTVMIGLIGPHISLPAKSNPTASLEKNAERLDQHNAIAVHGVIDVQGLIDLGELALRRGKPHEALDLFHRAVQQQIIKTDERNEVVVDLLVRLANTHFWLEDELAAREAGQRALKLIDSLSPGDSPDRLRVLRMLAEVLIGTGEYEEADRLLNEASMITRRTYRQGHAHHYEANGLLGTLRLAQQRTEEAEKLLRQTVRDVTDTRGAADLKTLHWRIALAAALVDGNKHTQAEAELRAIIPMIGALARDHPYLATANHFLARSLVGQNRPEEAISFLRQQLVELRKERASASRIARVETTLAEAMLLQGELVAAESLLVRADQVLSAKRGWPLESEGLRARSDMQRLIAMKLASQTDVVRAAQISSSGQ